MASIKEQFRLYLATRHRKLTRVQALILDAASALHSPFTPEMLATALSANAPDIRVSRATIFRTLQLLIDSGLASTEQGQSTPFQKIRLVI